MGGSEAEAILDEAVEALEDGRLDDALSGIYTALAMEPAPPS